MQPCCSLLGISPMPHSSLTFLIKVDFFLSRYNEAYVAETVAFCDSLVNDSPVPCTGEDGLVALIMAIAADKSAAENRWVKFSEIVEKVYCSSPTECQLIASSDVFPEGFKPAQSVEEFLLPAVDESGSGSGSGMKRAFARLFGVE